jgi:hypothetical protein
VAIKGSMFRNGSQDNLHKNYKFHGCCWRVPESNKVRSYNKFIAIRFWMQKLALNSLPPWWNCAPPACSAVCNHNITLYIYGVLCLCTCYFQHPLNATLWWCCINRFHPGWKVFGCLETKLASTTILIRNKRSPRRCAKYNLQLNLFFFVLFRRVSLFYNALSSLYKNQHINKIITLGLMLRFPLHERSTRLLSIQFFAWNK